jgi:general secretion pathway protein B
VPDLHAQLLPLGSPEAEAEPPRSSPLIWLGVGVLLAGIAGGAWWAFSGGESAAPAPVPVAQAPAQAVPPPASVPAAPANVAVEAPPATAQPTVRAESAASRSTPKAAAKATAAASAPAAAAPKPRPKPAAPAPAPAPTPAPAPATAPPPAPAVRVPSLAELPGDLRQQVPPLVIGGSVYSPQASVRMVIVNGQVFQEGSILAPELKLEQIRQKTAVFSIRGQRFEVPL